MSAPKDMVVRTISLDSLPTEVFLIICRHLDTNTLIQSVMYVNKQFYNIINDNYLWKQRFVRKFNNSSVAFMMTSTYNGPYGIDSTENSFNWKKCSWYTEQENNYWSNHTTNTSVATYQAANFAEVDAVLMNKDSTRCLSTSRDHSMYLWNIESKDTNPIVNKVNGHTDCVWSLKTYDENRFISCSWDARIKLWDMPNFSQASIPVQTFISESAVLSIASKDNFIAAGLHTSKIDAYDPRNGERIFQLHPHTRSVIDLCLIKDYYLVSLSEDKLMSICDLRVNRTVLAINLAKGTHTFPISASYYEDVLFVCDSQAFMYWLDCSDGSFNKIMTVKFSRSPEDRPRSHTEFKLNCVKCTNYGSILIGGSNGTVYIITPTSSPKIITKLYATRNNSDVTSMDYNCKNKTLVVGYVNSNIRVWQKK